MPGAGGEWFVEWLSDELGWAVGCRFSLFFLILLGKQLVVERIFEYNRCMQLGEPPATTRQQRSPADEILDNLNNNLTELLTAIDSGALDHLEAAEKIA